MTPVKIQTTTVAQAVANACLVMMWVPVASIVIQVTQTALQVKTAGGVPMAISARGDKGVRLSPALIRRINGGTAMDVNQIQFVHHLQFTMALALV